MNDYQLEAKMVKYRDLLSIEIEECNEPLVEVTDILCGYLPEMEDMKKYAGNKILVRKTVYDRLLYAQRMLKKESPGYSLFITYGYRRLEIQTMRFLKRLRDLSNHYYQNPVDLYEAVHRSVAVPSVAGHPTGGAVDLSITNRNFGSKMYDYTSKNHYVFSQNISKEAKQNRMLLRRSMMKAGFAPFDGEWWHFSYGDREWAFYYKKKSALYDQFSTIS